MSTTKDYEATATKHGAPIEGDRPVALNKMGRLLGVDDNTPFTWSHRGVLPPHVDLLGRSRYWWESEIKAWYAQRQESSKTDSPDTTD